MCVNRISQNESLSHNFSVRWDEWFDFYLTHSTCTNTTNLSGWFHLITVLHSFTGTPVPKGGEFGCGALPNFENEFQQNFQRTLKYAKALNCKKWVIWRDFTLIESSIFFCFVFSHFFFLLSMDRIHRIHIMAGIPLEPDAPENDETYLRWEKIVRKWKKKSFRIYQQ